DPKSARPTSALLKRKFFDSHQSMEGQNFYDICAGSGSIGFEALSRGASKVCFVEAAAGSFKVLKKNLELIREKASLSGRVELVKSDCVKWLKGFDEPGENIFYFDPPYENVALYRSFLETFMEVSKERSVICSKFIMEFCRQKTAPEAEVQSWFGKPDKFYRQGTSFLYIYDFS
ncbi:MAG: RsmD family RNA methyltransferase, partial [Bacteriovoracaceae bacterium]